jgi:hypothetical protein
MRKEEIVKEVITILDTSSYIDPAEHLYDGLKKIKREITYATVHDFLWALESSTVIDVDGKVTECANKIKPLLADMTIDEAYKNYMNQLIFNEENCHVDDLINKPNKTFIPYNQEEFNIQCKNNPEFSEKWGLKIEEMKLSFNERYELCKEKTNENPLKYSDENGNYPEHIQKPVLKLMESENIPTKLITITYNDKTIESYE